MTYTKVLMNSMTPTEGFINDVLNDAYLKAVENESGKITISQLDEIVFAHPYYEEVSLDTIEDAVIEIEQILEKNNRLQNEVKDRTDNLQACREELWDAFK